MIDFDELKALCERATPGPWMHTPGYYNDSGGQYDQIDSPVEIISGEWGGPSGDNAAFIAAANPATVLALLSANREMRKALEFYADEPAREFPNDGPWGVNSDDFGRVARSALTTQRGGE